MGGQQSKESPQCFFFNSPVAHRNSHSSSSQTNTRSTGQAQHHSIPTMTTDTTKVTTQDSQTSKTIRHNVSRNTLDIEHAWHEDEIVKLSIGGSGKKEHVIENPHDITSEDAMAAAAEEINSIIKDKGTISALESANIIQEKMKVLHLLWQHFPGAMSSKDVLQRFRKVVEPRGYTDDNTLFAQSVCPDEINHEEGDITDLFTKYCGEVFHMGGLAGIPFTGKVGFGAFSHHVPDGGHCAVLLAPHIGIDLEGNFGAHSREGQTHAGSCCGAAVGAYVHCRSKKPMPDLAVDPEFYQFNFIVNQVNQNMGEVVGETENDKQSSLARLMHRIGSDLLEKCISVDFGNDKSTLVVLTGIQINMPKPFDDFFLPMQFFIMKKDGTREDVFEEAFGPRHNFVCKPCAPNAKSSERTTKIVG